MANTTGKKFGGRKKGVPNANTKLLRDKINDLLDGNWERVLEDLEALKPKERLDIYARLLEYSLPKMSRVEIRAEEPPRELTLEEKQARVKELMENADDETKDLLRSGSI